MADAVCKVHTQSELCVCVLYTVYDVKSPRFCFYFSPLFFRELDDRMFAVDSLDNNNELLLLLLLCNTPADNPFSLRVSLHLIRFPKSFPLGIHVCA